MDQQAERVIKTIAADENVGASFRAILAGNPLPERTLSPAIGEHAIQECARLQSENLKLRSALEMIAEVCNGYGLEAGWACKHAREALAKVPA